MFAAAIPAAIGAASAYASYKGQRDANQDAKNMSREQMDFQERMSSTAWQRGVKDMKAAGINPMLAVAQGGASSPGGAQSTPQSTTSNLTSSAKEGSLIASQIANMNADTRLKDANVKTAQAQLPGTAAGSALEANKSGFLNDMIDILKGFTHYGNNVKEAKSTSPSWYDSILDTINGAASSAKSKYNDARSYLIKAKQGK